MKEIAYTLYAFTVICLFVITVFLVLMSSTISGMVRFNQEEWGSYTQLKKAIAEEGYTIKILVFNFNNIQAVRNDSIILIFSPLKPYDVHEIDLLKEKVSAGSTLIIQDRSINTYYLLKAFNITRGLHTLYEFESYRKRQDLPIEQFHYAGISGNLSFRQPQPLIEIPRSAEVISMSSPQSYMDIDDNEILDDQDGKGPFPLIISLVHEKGTVVVISDSHLLTNDLLNRTENRGLFESLLRTLGNPEKNHVIIDESHSGKSNFFIPTINLFIMLLKNEWLVILFSLCFALLFLAQKIADAIHEQKKRVKRDRPENRFSELVHKTKREAVLSMNMNTWLVVHMGDELMRQMKKRLNRKDDTSAPEILADEFCSYFPVVNPIDLKRIITRIQEVKNKKNAVRSFEEAKKICDSIEDLLHKIQSL
ncbi:MAG: DUF4350 domain-containing protein [Nanoarchaeota archaeon]